MLTYGFKVHPKVMLVPANYYFLYQELCLFVCLQAHKKVDSTLLLLLLSKCPGALYWPAAIDAVLHLQALYGDLLSLFLSFFLSNTHHSSTHHPLPLHPLVMCAPCLVTRAPVILGRSATTTTPALANVLPSGMEAARAMPITSCPWTPARQSVVV